MIRIPRSRRDEVRLTVSIVFIIGIVLANQVHAEDFSIQPLTRIDCDKAEMAWDENANVCIAGSGGSSQPLTKNQCEKAHMRWNDRANVCGEKSGTQAAATSPVSSSIVVNIDKTK